MKRVLLATLALILLGVIQASAQTWTSTNYIPNAHHPASAFTIGDYGYHCNPNFGDVSSDEVWRFDANAQNWQRMNDLPTGFKADIPFVIDGKAYALDGYDSTFYQYDPIMDQWTQKADFPGTPRIGCSFFAAQGCGYIGMGRDEPGYWLDDFWKYDPIGDTWTQVASFAGGVRMDGISFSLGDYGYAGLGVITWNLAQPYANDLYRYDPATDTWTQMANLPSLGRYCTAEFSMNGKGYVVSGQVANPATEWTQETWRYSPDTDSWDMLAAAPYYDCSTSFVLGNSAYLENWGTLWRFSEDNGSTPCPSLTGTLQQGLVGYWPFCGNANDESGNGNDGVVNGATLTEDRFGNAGSAYDLNGLSDYITVPTIPELDGSAEFSISAWILPQEQTGWRQFIVSRGYDGGDGSFFLCHEGNGPNIVPAVTDGLRGTVNGYGSSNILSLDSYSIPYSNWQHVVLNKKQGSIEMYVDGVLIDTLAYDLPLYSSLEPINFGLHQLDFFPYYFSGLLDDIGIWNRALTAEEITSLYTGEPVVQPACAQLDPALQQGLVGYWPFCGNASDESGNGNDGVVNGATLTEDRFGNVGSAYHFDGLSNSINTISQLPTAEISISFWEKIDAFNFSYPIGLGINSSIDEGYGVGIGGVNNNGGILARAQFAYDGQTGFANTISSEPVLEINEWYHVVFEHANGISKIYINGVLAAQGNNLTFPSFSNIVFGMRSDSLFFFDGSLDDIGIWNRALTAEEIALLYGNFNPEWLGCTVFEACNYNALSSVDDGSCLFIGNPCDDGSANTTNDIIDADCSCAGILVEIGAPHTCGADFVHNPNLTYGSMTDQEGNIYKTIVIGEQEWMAENLNTSIYRNGDAITTNLNFIEWETTTSGSWSYYNDNANGECPFGKLYNWYTVSDPRQLCPSGWHVPTEEEWNSLIEYLGGYSVAGGKMKSTGNIDLTTGLWYSPNGGATNSSGFSGLPGGDRNGGGAYYDLGLGVWWTSTTLDDINAYSKILNYTDGALQPSLNNYHYGFSVRCMNDEAVGLIPGCTDTFACNYNMDATEDDGSCTFTGDACDDGIASTANDILGADCGCAGTAVELGTPHTCGADLVHNPNLTYGSMTDQEGNVYKTIVIGGQEWMAENLNTSIYRNGDSIPTNLNDNEWSNTSNGAWTYYNDDINFACPYGKLYNWYACTDTRQLCPVGWHVPSDAEWSALINHLDPFADGGNNMGNVAGSMMKSSGTIEDGTGLWFDHLFVNNQLFNNISGFSGVPGGVKWVNGPFEFNGLNSYFWSATENDTDNAWDRNLDNAGDFAYREYQNKHYGFSARCLRDNNTGLIPGCTDPLAFNYNPEANVNEGCLYTASVFVYNDLNGNGEHESNEPGLSNWPVVGNDINGLLWTNGNGNAFVAVPQGAYQFTVLNTTDNWVLTTEASGILSVGNSCIDQNGIPIPCPNTTLSFGLQVIPGEAIVAAGPFTGFWDILHCTDGYESGVYLENIGSQTVSGFMTLTCDPLFTPNASSYFTTPPAETGPGYALWNIDDFLPGEYELLSYFVPGPGVEYLNAVFNFSLELTLLDPQGNIIFDETWDASPIVACAYDPNDLTGYPEGLDSPHDEGYTIEHFMRPDNMVEFRVRFQNTGTLPAEDIDIYIPIDASVWDLSTIEPLARAADMQVLCLHDGGDIDFSLYDSLEHDLPEGVVATDLLIFSFEDIFLPDSASDPDGSQGYVFFQMQAKHGLDVNTELNAQAFIYFEQNPPITTNETYHVIFDCESFTPMVGDTEICDGESLMFDATQPYVDTLQWQLNNVVIGNDFILDYPAEVGEYTLELITGNVLCSPGKTHEVTVIVHEIPELEIGLDETVCEGEQIIFNGNSDGSIIWSNGATTGDTIVATESFVVTATVIGEGGCTSTRHWSVTVNPTPSNAVDITGNVLSAEEGNSWNWSFNGVDIASTQSITVESSGNYQVDVTNEFGCSSASDIIFIENIFVHSWPTLTAYPNPMKDLARIELPEGTFDMALYDMTGRSVWQCSSQRGMVILERGTLASGVYQLRMSNADTHFTTPLILE
jgi:uncharacterized protein (TIGR02145 family)